MLKHILADISDAGVIFFATGILVAFLLLFAAFCIGWRVSRWEACPSPYSKLPMRRATSLSYSTLEKVLRYLHDLKQYDNRMFDVRKASFCRETGRIFQDSINWYDIISVDWDFLQRRHPGKYVSWGSLTLEQQSDIRDRHDTLEGFQTKHSSKRSAPRDVEPEYAMEKPGPLYVDIYTATLLGWKEVPGTEMEVLIVQKPKPTLLKKFTPIERT